MATAVAAAVAKARRDIQHHFFCHDAVRPDRAVAVDPTSGIQPRPGERLQTPRNKQKAKPALYWLDVVAYDVDLRERFNRVRIVLLAIVIGLAIALGFSVGLSK